MKSKRLGKKLAIGVGAVLLVAGIAAGVGCTANNTQTSGGSATNAASSSASTAEAGEGTVAQYAEMFPLEYSSLMTTWTNADGKQIGHSLFRDICEAPLPRDMNGDVLANEDGSFSIAAFHYDTASGKYVIDDLTDDQLDEYGLYSGCVSCKSSKFNDLYDKYGAKAFTSVYNAEARAIVNGEYFDCGLCHTGTPGTGTVTANAMYFNALGEGLIEELPEGDLVCAQCHNSYDYRRYIKTDEDLQNDRPYRHGYDIDGLMQTCLEDGTNFDVDAETGMQSSFLTHPDIEMFMGTAMQKAGVTCVDCHMTLTTDDATGEKYTSHNATQSPLENEDALNYCLTCHESQGISSTDEMVKFVRGKQAGVAAAQEAMEAKEASFKAALEDAIKSNSKDSATLEQAKALYAKVTWYDCVLVSGPDEQPGAKAAMMDGEGIAEKADAMCDQGLALLS